MASAPIVTRTTRSSPPTSTHPQPPLRLPPVLRCRRHGEETGELTLTYAMQIHAGDVEIDAETGEMDVVGHAAVDDGGVPIHPQNVEGRCTSRPPTRSARPSTSTSPTTRTARSSPQLLRLPRAARDGHAAAQTGAMESRSPVAPLGAKGMGEGGGGGIHCICAAIQDALRPAGGPVVSDELQTHRIARGRCSRDPAASRANVSVEVEVIVSGTKELAPRATVWSVINDPGGDGGAHAGRRELRDPGRDALDRQGQGSARPRWSQDDDGFREARGARAQVRLDAGEGTGRRRADGHDHRVHARRGRRGHLDGLGGGREDRRPGRGDGPARAPADREPAGQRRCWRRSTEGVAASSGSAPSRGSTRPRPRPIRPSPTDPRGPP